VKSSFVALVRPVRISTAASEGNKSTSWRQQVNFMEMLRNVPGSIIQAANIFAWDLVETMLHKSLNPVLEDTDNWLSHVESTS
jgi:hypothetical protein